VRHFDNLVFQLGFQCELSECVCCAHLPWLLQELTLLQGKHTNEFAAVLGYATDGELIHRGNLALLLAGELGC
jgi:glutamate 5-kinase